MDEPYRIEVLHIVNPHVIFIESQSQKDVPVIEQVGIYGVLPVSKTIDIDGKVVAERCENWPISANTILREFLADNKDCLYFAPIHVAEKSTILDENCHRFGDIVAISDNKISISDHFVNVAVAIKDVSNFHHKLATGSLKIKLNSTRTDEVVKSIKKYYQSQKKVKHDWEKTINSQIILHQEGKKITAELTEKNLKLFERNLDLVRNVIIDRKENNPNLYKDVDMVSVGRGSRRNPSRPNSTTPVKKPIIKGNKEYGSHDILNDVKNYLERNGEVKYESSNNSLNLKSENEFQKTPKVNYEDSKTGQDKPEMPQLKHQDDLKKCDKLEDSLLKMYLNQNFKCDIQEPEYNRNNVKICLRSNHNNSLEKSVYHTTSTPKIETSPRNRVQATRHQGKTEKTQAQVKVRKYAICPDMQMTAENMKSLVTITSVEEFNTNNSKPPQINIPDEKTEEPAIEEDNCGDSNVNLEISNLDRFKISRQKPTTVDPTEHKKNYDNNTHGNNKTHSRKPCSDPINGAPGQIRAGNRLASSILLRKLQDLKESQKKQANSFSSNSDTSVKDTTSSSTEQSKVETTQLKIDPEQDKVEPDKPITQLTPILAQNVQKPERNVNPFKNLDGSKSVFVDKLVSPILMVHTKNDNLILPQSDLRDIPFKNDIHCVLKALRVNKPKRLQTVTWTCILRGHSMFMVSPANNGKTLGYIPAVCNLVTDSNRLVEGVGPICVIVCATALSVSEVESYCKRFLDVDQRIVTGFPGIDVKKVTTSLLNGCHVLIATAPMLVRYLEADFGVDLRRLQVLIFDDCERLSQVYASELSHILNNVKDMLKKRADKSLKVQYVVASRQWCDFMTSLAKKAPDTVIAIGAAQECVLYSKAWTSVKYVNSQADKVNVVIDFLKEVDTSKPTVIVCRSDDEVDILENTLTALKHTVFACNSTMTLHDLYKLSGAWDHYKEPRLGPIMICCDGNLTHLNITNANHLVHFSMPALFSMFCKRFSVLNENYASIFGPNNDKVKIKILLDETNVEQLPKILSFVKRCTKEEFPVLDNVVEAVLKHKDWNKAEILTPICNNLLMVGECMDVWNCQDRHTVFKEFDEPQDWMPKQGVVTFKIMHYDSAVTYSARVLTKTTKSGTLKYPNNYNTLSLKMGMYFSKDTNRRLHGILKVGDICAVALKQNFFERCKVMKIIPANDKNSTHVLINLIDEEQLTITKDVNLYHLPADLKAIDTHVVKVRLANIQPKDNDVTYSIEAQDYLQRYTNRDLDNSLYVRGRVVMTLGNCIFVDSAEICADLSSLGETVVKRDIKIELLGRHADPFPQHIEKLKKLCGEVSPVDEFVQEVPKKVQKRTKWAHLEKDDFTTVFVVTAVDARTVFVCHAKFQKEVKILHKDIQEQARKASELIHEEIYAGNIVVAQFPDDNTYKRARIDEVLDDKKVKCFFVDNGHWREVLVTKLRPITDRIMHRIPFQAIECRLVGVKPPGDADDWPEFSTTWLYDNCFKNPDGNLKNLFVRYFTKEKATVTGGHKYGVVLLDTNTDTDVVINKIMIELNLAKENKEESRYINEPLNLKPVKITDSSSDEENTLESDNLTADKVIPIVKDLVPVQSQKTYENYGSSDAARNMVFGTPIRSFPLVNDSDSDVSDKWDVNVDDDMLGMFGQPSSANPNITEYKPEKAADEENNTSSEKEKAVEKRSENVINNAICNKIKEASSNSSLVSKGEVKTENEFLELTSKSPMLENDSDDDNIGTERTAALNIFKTKMFSQKMNERYLKKPLKIEIKANNNTVEQITTDILNHSQNSDIVEKSNKNVTLDSDDLSSVVSEKQPVEAIKKDDPKYIEVIDPPRKPKLVWRQNKNAVTFKINMVGVENYVLEIQDKRIRFHTWHNDTTYEFDFELYGVVKPEKSVHSNKGQYIQVNLVKMLQRNWLNLTKDFGPKKWIVYDVDAIDLSSDEEDDHNNEALKTIKHNHNREDSASDEDDFHDDMDFTYNTHR